MKLSSADVANLSSILNTCQIGGVDAIIFENGQVRGMNEERSFIIISDVDVPNLSQKMGVTRLASLKQRLDLFAGNNPVIDAAESDRGEITSLNISAGKSKVQFRCTSTTLISAPKQVNDTELLKVSITKEELKTILDAIRIMGTKTLQLIVRKTGDVSICFNDATNDTFNIDLSNKADHDGDSVIFYYYAQIFASVMKHSEVDTNVLLIGEMGTAKTLLQGHPVVIMPKINEDADEDE